MTRECGGGITMEDLLMTTTPLDYGLPPAGYRLPDATRVGHVRLQVRDLQRSLDYYTAVIGLHADPDTQPVPRRGVFGLYHFAILLPDRASLGRFVTHLAALGVRAGAADHLVSEALYLTDPDGLGIEVYADRSKASWRHAQRELAMASDPLDFAAVAAAGHGAPWTGAPAGTTMGHVHLHVGDLDEARRFYHGALGFDVTVWSYPGALFFSAGGYHHHLGTNTWSPGPAEDAAAAAHSLLAGRYQAVPDGAIWTATDPWGTRVVLRQG
jgi:catechol 2,3-dioxygenase